MTPEISMQRHENTIVCMEGNIYHNFLSPHTHVEVILPTQSERGDINNTIRNKLLNCNIKMQKFLQQTFCIAILWNSIVVFYVLLTHFGYFALCYHTFALRVPKINYNNTIFILQVPCCLP